LALFDVIELGSDNEMFKADALKHNKRLLLQK